MVLQLLETGLLALIFCLNLFFLYCTSNFHIFFITSYQICIIFGDFGVILLKYVTKTVLLCNIFIFPMILCSVRAFCICRISNPWFVQINILFHLLFVLKTSLSSNCAFYLPLYNFFFFSHEHNLLLNCFNFESLEQFTLYSSMIILSIYSSETQTSDRSRTNKSIPLTLKICNLFIS